ncbi:MAG: RNase adapter RapZ, partial [Acidimicrobiales bacterium]
MSEFLVIAGLSGAGRSTAADVLEDLGWFVIDNMPPTLITKVADLVGRPGSETGRVALVVGRGGGEYLDEVTPALDALRATGARVRVLFLDASDDVLVRRFEGTRRRHPLSADEGVVSSILQERQMLDPIKDQADVVVDT